MDELVETHPNDVGLIDALIEELDGDEETLSQLQDEVPKWHWGFNPPFEFKRFGACWAKGRRIFLMKIYDEDGHLIDFRVFVAYDIDTDEYFVLSVANRTTSYDTDTQAHRDLCARYDGLSIPTFGSHA